MPKKAPAAPRPALLAGCVVAIKGKLDHRSGHTHKSLGELVISLGGTLSSSIAGKTTHLVCSLDYYAKYTSNVEAAEARALPVVSPAWLFETDETDKLADTGLHLWSLPHNDPLNSVPGSHGAAGNSDSASTKKRTLAASDEPDTADEPKPKKSRGAEPDSEPAATDMPKPNSTKASQTADGDNESVVSGAKATANNSSKPNGFHVPLDEHCPYVPHTVYIDPSGVALDASLNQTNATNNNNKFYRIQVCRVPSRSCSFNLIPLQLLVDETTQQYATWTRWGRVGEVGQSATACAGDLPSCMKHFEKKFRSKSGLAWQNRKDDPKPGSYVFVERSYEADEVDGVASEPRAAEKSAKSKEKNGDNYTQPESQLEAPVKELMKLIFNHQFFENTMAALNYDASKLPLGKLSKATILRGFQQLKDLAALMNDPGLASTRWSRPVPDAIEMLSNMYYSIIPHAFGRHRPPVIQDRTVLEKEIDLLQSLSDMKEASDIMKLDANTAQAGDTLHPMDRQFHALGLQEMTCLDPASTEFRLLHQYLDGSRGATHGMTYTVQHIFRIERGGEKQRFEQSDLSRISTPDRRLLWHGSRCTNFGGILSQGLRIAPPEAPVSGYMFGKGIYLADASSKSAGYCAAYNSRGNALLLLCEAELGAPMQRLCAASYSAGEDAHDRGLASTMGMGMTGPAKWVDAWAVHESLKGVIMVCSCSTHPVHSLSHSLTPPTSKNARALFRARGATMLTYMPPQFTARQLDAPRADWHRRRNALLQRVHLLRRGASQAPLPLPRQAAELKSCHHRGPPCESHDGRVVVRSRPSYTLPPLQ